MKTLRGRMWRQASCLPVSRGFQPGENERRTSQRLRAPDALRPIEALFRAAGCRPHWRAGSTPLLALAALMGALVIPASAAAADETNPWHFDTALNLFLASLSGDVAAKGHPTHVDASFGDIAEQLDFAAAGRVTVGYDRWSVSTEFSYMKLGPSAAAANVELKQWLVEPSLGYKFCAYFEGFAGARYNNIDGTINFHGPLGQVRGGTQEWWDPIVGAQLSFPLIRNKLTFDGRFDIGGFGVSSDLTWQAYPYLNWRFAKWGSAQLGYRWLGTDYETGSGASLFRYDVVLQGPQIGFTFHF